MPYCPYLCLLQDPDTHFSFPSQHNCCRRVKPVQPVDLAYQLSSCLSENHISCPVYLGNMGNWKGALPVEVRGRPPAAGRWRKGWLWIVLAGTLPALLLAAFLISGWVSRRPATSVKQSILLPVETQTPFASQTQFVFPETHLDLTPEPTPTVAVTAMAATAFTPTPVASTPVPADPTQVEIVSVWLPLKEILLPIILMGNAPGQSSSLKSSPAQIVYTSTSASPLRPTKVLTPRAPTPTQKPVVPSLTPTLSPVLKPTAADPTVETEAPLIITNTAAAPAEPPPTLTPVPTITPLPSAAPTRIVPSPTSPPVVPSSTPVPTTVIPPTSTDDPSEPWPVTPTPPVE